MEGPAETQVLNTSYCFILRVLGLTQKVNFESESLKVGKVLRTHLVQSHHFTDGALRPRGEGLFQWYS